MRERAARSILCEELWQTTVLPRHGRSGIAHVATKQLISAIAGDRYRYMLAHEFGDDVLENRRRIAEGSSKWRTTLVM